jgi:hypothetical protein
MRQLLTEQEKREHKQAYQKKWRKKNKKHHREYQRNWYAKNIGYQKKHQKKWYTEHKLAKKKVIITADTPIEYRIRKAKEDAKLSAAYMSIGGGGECYRCGLVVDNSANKLDREKFIAPSCSFTWHHKDPNQKDWEISTILHKPPMFVLKEIKKCNLLCKVCHPPVHHILYAEDKKLVNTRKSPKYKKSHVRVPKGNGQFRYRKREKRDGKENQKNT